MAAEVAPRQKTLGVMLAYTPLHHLLLRDVDRPLVMTSGNRSDEPIAYRDEEAFEQLGDIADYFLVHDRPIQMRCDDSVARVVERGCTLSGARAATLRAPAGLPVASTSTPWLAGASLRTPSALRRSATPSRATTSGTWRTTRPCGPSGRVEHYCRLFDVQPGLVAYDLHPEYLSTKYARELEEAGLPAVGVQHHHAHVASCLADNERPSGAQIIGVALDGTGYGTDGAIWGGEFFEGSMEGWVHAAGAPGVCSLAGRSGGDPAPVAHGARTAHQTSTAKKIL